MLAHRGEVSLVEAPVRLRSHGEHHEYYHFQVFNSLTDQGFRFTLDKKQALAFCDWLDQINEYALKHGEGI